MIDLRRLETFAQAARLGSLSAAARALRVSPAAVSRPARLPKPDGLSDHRLRRLADVIEAHLAEDLSLDAMAEWRV